MSKRIMTINSMADMVELVNHNFAGFDCSIKKLTRNNQNLGLLCLLAVGLAIYAGIKSQKHEEEVYKLSIRVDKLEHDEGA